MSWYSGSQLTTTSEGTACTAKPMPRMFASTFACVSVTPFGSPVLPEVYWMKNTSSGLLAGSARPRPRSARSAALRASRKEGRPVPRTFATARARSKEMRNRTSALRRMSAWRRTYSSNWFSRAGG